MREEGQELKVKKPYLLDSDIKLATQIEINIPRKMIQHITSNSILLKHTILRETIYSCNEGFWH